MSIAALLFVALQTPSAEKPFALMVGDPAPPLRVAEWVQGEPIARFEPGNVYVVEFWATWCPPCKESIPRLDRLARQYEGKARFVGVSIWERIGDGEPYRVPEFVRAMGERMTFTVAADRVTPLAEDREENGAMALTWMRAAGQRGIPASFVVDRAGRVAWIGSPFRIDQPLAEIVGGRWDIEAEAKRYAFDQRLRGEVARLNAEITAAKKLKDWTAAIRVIERAVEAQPLLEPSLGLDKYFLLLEARRPADAAAYGERLVAQVLRDNANALNQLAWAIVNPQKKGEGDLSLALRAAKRAVELLEWKDANSLDTLALALFRSGRVTEAAEIQERAVEIARAEGSPYLEDMSARLEEFRNAAKGL